MKFCTTKRANMPLGWAKFHVNRCNGRPCGAKMLIFDLIKFKYRLTPLRGVLPVKYGTDKNRYRIIHRRFKACLLHVIITLRAKLSGGRRVSALALCVCGFVGLLPR